MAAEIWQKQDHLESKSNITERYEAIQQLLSYFKLTDTAEPGSNRPGLLEIARRLNAQIEQGLCRDGQPTSDIPMFPAYVETLPNGKETGEYLALDLGGTWFRVFFFRLNGRGGVEFAATPHVQAIPEAIMRGHGSHLFDAIVFAIDALITRLAKAGQVAINFGETKRDFPLGFTFSFPCRQMAIDSAIITKMTKGFACEGVAGKDVVALLHEARDRRKIMKFSFHCACLINDSVGCLTSLAVSIPDTRVGVIFGTGTNACYPEHIERIGTLPPTYNGKEGGVMLINTEWGSFGSVSRSLADVRNCYDEQLDRESLNRGEQLFEKMISGMYMGEILRLLITDMIKLGLLLPDYHDHEVLSHSALFQRNQLHTKYLSEIENDMTHWPPAREMMTELGVDEKLVTDADCEIIYACCEAVSGRAANLAAVGLATVLKRIVPPQSGVIIVGVDGSLVRFHRHFRQALENKTRELLDLMNFHHVQFKVELSSDGSALGTAAVAAAARPDRIILDIIHEAESK